MKMEENIKEEEEGKNKIIYKLHRAAAKSPRDSDDDDDEIRYYCKLCDRGFSNAQALGGHSSRKHPGKSLEYNHKKLVREKRQFLRSKLLLAKIMYFDSLGEEFRELQKTRRGKDKIKRLMNRAQLKRVKAALEDSEVNEFIYSQGVDDSF